VTFSSMLGELNKISMENSCHQYLLNLVTICPVCEVKLEKETKMKHIQSHAKSSSVKKTLSIFGSTVPLFTEARAKLYVLEGILNHVNLSDDEKNYYNAVRENMQKALFFS